MEEGVQVEQKGQLLERSGGFVASSYFFCCYSGVPVPFLGLCSVEVGCKLLVHNV